MVLLRGNEAGCPEHRLRTPNPQSVYQKFFLQEVHLNWIWKDELALTGAKGEDGVLELEKMYLNISGKGANW